MMQRPEARPRRRAALGPVAALCLLAGCATTADPPVAPVPAPAATPPAAPPVPPRKVSPYAPAREDLSKRGDYVAGGLYAPGVRDRAPEELPQVELIPEPEVVAEPRSRYGNRSPYSVLGKSYAVLDSPAGYVDRGIASYYGQKFHGRRTSSLEVYDMYTFSAAHKTLPLPSYARVTNLANGKSVVVRVNDRGPFHEGRIIDLSYAAAVKLDIHRTGIAQVEVEALVPGAHGAHDMPVQPAVAAPAPPSPMDGLVATLPAAVAAEPIQLQVGSFSSRDNAERVVARLSAAGIEGARVLDAATESQPIWRVRVGPVPASEADRLADRVAALGLGRPRFLRDP